MEQKNAFWYIPLIGGKAKFVTIFLLTFAELLQTGEQLKSHLSLWFSHQPFLALNRITEFNSNHKLRN